MEVGREKLEEYQQAASAEIATLESKLPTVQDAEEWKEFVRGESGRLLQEYMLGNTWVETARMEADELHQELLFQLHNAEVSVQLQAETLLTAASLDEIQESIMNWIPLSQKLISSFKFPEISMDVKAIDMEGMNESARGQWGKLSRDLSQVELPALPKLDTFGVLEHVMIPKVDMSGLQDFLKIAAMPAKIDLSVMSDALEWSAFDVSGLKETAQGIVNSASDKVPSIDMGERKSPIDTVLFC